MALVSGPGPRPASGGPLGRHVSLRLGGPGACPPPSEAWGFAPRERRVWTGAGRGRGRGSVSYRSRTPGPPGEPPSAPLSPGSSRSLEPTSSCWLCGGRLCPR